MSTRLQIGYRSKLPRLIAGLMAFVCLWMGTVCVAHHTDEFQTVATAQAHSSVHLSLPHAPSAPCVACEWLTNLLPRLASTVYVALTPGSRVAFAAAPARFSPPRTLLCLPPRGPPASLPIAS